MGGEQGSTMAPGKLKQEGREGEGGGDEVTRGGAREEDRIMGGIRKPLEVQVEV